MGERNALQRVLYRDHRKNVRLAEKKIKTEPPPLLAEYYVSHGILAASQGRLNEIEYANRQLVTKINLINRTKHTCSDWWLEIPRGVFLKKGIPGRERELKRRIRKYNYGDIHHHPISPGLFIIEQNIDMSIKKLGVVNCHQDSFIKSSNYKTRVIRNLQIEKANRDLYELIKLASSKYTKKAQMESFNDRKKTLLFISRHPEIYKNELLDPLERWSICPDKNHPDMEKFNPQKRVRCFFDFEILNERKLGRMYIEVYNDFAPIAGENFLRLVRGEKGKGYKNTELYIIMPGMGLLGGDVDHADGASTTSSYGKPFVSENYSLQFTGPGVIASFTLFPGLNFCQFFISFRELPYLKNVFVVLGRVIKNLRTLEMIEEFGTKSGKPRKPITITNCGVFQKK